MKAGRGSKWYEMRGQACYIWLVFKQAEEIREFKDRPAIETHGAQAKAQGRYRPALGPRSLRGESPARDRR
jgi:hypothetical protein